MNDDDFFKQQVTTLIKILGLIFVQDDPLHQKIGDLNIIMTLITQKLIIQETDTDLTCKTIWALSNVAATAGMVPVLYDLGTLQEVVKLVTNLDS